MGSGKKRRLSEGSDEGGEEPRPKKPRGPLWRVPPALDKQVDLCLKMFNSLRKCKDSDNRNMSDFLMRAPSRRLWPKYYNIVTNPIDLMKIQQKVKTDEYTSVMSFFTDIQLLFDNSLLFYSPSSDEYHQVENLESAFTLIVSEYGFGSNAELLSDSDSVKSPTNLTLRISKSHFQSPVKTSHKTDVLSALDIKTSMLAAKLSQHSSKAPAVMSGRGKSVPWVHEYSVSGDPIKMYLAAIHDHIDPSSGELLSEPFHYLPSRSEYPEYYKVITQPMDLDTIHKRTEAGEYLNLKMIQNDMILMVKNAHYFNEPVSDIYKKASSLRRIIISRCSDLEKKYQTVFKTCPPKVPAKCPPDLGSVGSEGEGKKIPKLKITVSESTRGHRSSMSSLSDLDVDDAQLLDSTDDELTSEEETKGDPTHSQGKLLLSIKKEQLGGVSSPSSQGHVDPVAKLLHAKKPPTLKKKLMCVYKRIVNKTDPQGRFLSDLFMRRPSSKLYPEYYLVIKDPVDLKEILKNIKNGGYSSLKEMEDAMELMAQNALTFNEEDSQIYSDALVLREVSQTTIKQIQKTWSTTPTSSPGLPTTSLFYPPAHVQRGRPRKVVPPGGVVTTPNSPIPSNVLALFNAVKNHSDGHRYVWLTFKKLPTGVSSDYYTVVKKPIDMTIIQSKVHSGGLYQNMDQLMDDLTLMLNNSFTFFPRQSRQSMDAITLQRAIINKYTILKASESGNYSSPDVKDSVEIVLSNILTRTLNSEEECVSVLRGIVATREEEFQDEGVVSHSFNLNNIEKWSEEGMYHRLDELQTDVLAVIVQATKEKGRGVTDKIARKFLSIRDELCGKDKGQLFSHALSYTTVELESDLEVAAHSHSKSLSPVNSPTKSVSHSNSASPKSESLCGVGGGGGADGTRCWEGERDGVKLDKCSRCVWEGMEYSVGDVVYVNKSSDETQDVSNIVLIDKFWKDSSNTRCFDGTWYYRPEETFHVAKKKFYEKEVFRTDFRGLARMSQITGKCIILFIKDFPKLHPQGFAEEDVFVCESRYSYKTKSFKKIKIWSWPGAPPTLLPRDMPLIMNKVPSIFVLSEKSVDRQDTPTDSEATPLDTKPLDELKREALDVSFVGLGYTNVKMMSSFSNQEPYCTYYQQYCIDDNYFRIGDCVYLRSDKENPYIVRIERMWTDKSGDPWIYGPWFLQPQEVNHAPTQTFYKHEVLLSNIQDKNPMRSICGQCSVLSIQNYTKKRLTRYAENDVFLYQSRYNEEDREIKKIKGSGVKEHQLSPPITLDEVFYLSHTVPLIKVASLKLFSQEFDPVNPTPTPTPPPALATPNEGSALPPNLGGKAAGINITPQLLQQLLASASKLSTTRPVVIPLQSSLTSVSSSLPSTTKLAQALLNNASVLKTATESGSSTPSPAPSPKAGHQSFPCLWNNCSLVYNGPLELYNHVVGTGPSHLSMEVEGSYFCRWKNCPRNPLSGGRSFDSLNKFMRHMREVHLMKLSTLFGIGSRSSGVPRATPILSQVFPQATPPPPPPVATIQTPPTATTSIISPTPAKIPAKTPTTTIANIFIPPPENRQTLVHSDIYKRYIQGVKSNSQYLSPCADSASSGSQAHTEPVEPEDWFSSEIIKGLGGSGTNDALWALKDHMRKESLKIAEYLDKYN